MSELHILNGDCALAIWKQCAFKAQHLVWKETYLDGPLPEGDDPALFRVARAEYLCHFAEVADIGKERLLKHLQRMDEAVLNLPPDEILMLWFDGCIFDQTILMRILYLLQKRATALPEIFLYCCNSNCLTMEDFQRGTAGKVRLTEEDLHTGAQAWRAFVRKDAKAMEQLAGEKNFADFPQMKKALLRCAEEVPGADGLNRTQRQILQIAAKERCTFREIFTNLSAFEENPFLGDTACLRLLDDMCHKGLLDLSPDGFYRLSEPKKS